MTVTRPLVGIQPLARRRVYWPWFICLAAFALLAACSGPSNPAITSEPAASTPNGAEELRSAVERETLPEVSDSELSDLVRGNGAFAFDLYRNLSDEDGNLFFSPHSISLALAMTYAGARGETESQMAETLHFLLPQDSLHPAFNALDLELASRSEGVQDIGGEGFRLNLVNAVWGQLGCTFQTEFLDLLAESYGAGVRPTDFLGSPEGSRTTINDWVSDQTEERIKDLVPPDGIDESTRMVLTNAIYFNAAWIRPFDREDTSDGRFHLLDGDEIDVPMMQQTASFWYAAGDGYQVLSLPYYANGPLSMVILLPDSGRFSEFEESLDAAVVDGVTKDLVWRSVSLSMPKFEFESGFNLPNLLKAMGMPDAFNQSKADFSGMGISGCPGGDGRLYISDVFHKAFVLVDEEGTEAAAATAAMVFVRGRPPPVSVSVDRPFIFLIRDRETGAVLFVGRVLDPSG